MKVYRLACSINQYINNLPNGCVTLELLSQTLNTSLEPKRGAWYYYKKIQEFVQKHPEKCKKVFGGFSQIDDHSKWPNDTLSEAERKLYENKIKSQMKETYDAVSKQAGTIPNELSEILNSILNKPEIFNWKQYFRRTVGNAITNDIQLTRMRPSKRLPDARGIRILRKPNILVGVDTSGSVSNENLADFFCEINHIYKSGVHITVAECDTTIHNIFDYKGTQNIKITGRGGTELEPIFTYYKEHPEFTVLVVFTDGYCNTEFISNKPVIWVITSDGNKSTNYTPGQTIFIP